MSEIKNKNLNSFWHERHQFVLMANDNIICQRYFKVNGFDPLALQSGEFYDVFNNVVQTIKKDLETKSRTYTAITMKNKMKMTGFYNGDDALDFYDACLAYSDSGDGAVTLSNGLVLDKTFLEYPSQEEVVEETPFTLKFSYLFDDKVVCEEIWDGNVYPKYVRNCIDLSNSNASYKNVDPMKMSFSQQMTKALVEGKKDLIYYIIKKFCSVLSNNVGENGNSETRDYTTTFDWGGKTYRYSSYPIDFVKGWAKAVRAKTNAYNHWAGIYNSK